MMQTMNSDELQPPSLPIRILLLLLSTASMIGAALLLAGVSFGIFCAASLVMTFLLLHKLGSQERARAKKSSPGRSTRPGS